jgi:DUF971 family protein
VPLNIVPTRIWNAGSYAIGVISDSHGLGIYTFGHLRASAGLKMSEASDY